MVGLPTPAQMRAALVAHVARKLGWSLKSAIAQLEGLTNSDIARCLHKSADDTRAALHARTCAALEAAGA